MIAKRLTEISQTLQAIQSGWPFFMAELQARIDAATISLISENNEQTRGRIKALRDLLDLPETLQQERDGITAALSEQSDAAL